MLDSINHTVRSWHDASSPFRPTLFDHLKKSEIKSRDVAQLEIGGRETLAESIHESTISSQQQGELDVLKAIEFPQWDCEHINLSAVQVFCLYLGHGHTISTRLP